jgi:c(7)-type cytochrome triheme protein
MTTMHTETELSARPPRVTALTVIISVAVVGLTALAVDAVRAGDPVVKAKVDTMTQAGQTALAQSFGRKHTASPLIIPDQTIPIRFSHAQHVDLVDCVECHSGVTTSLRAKDRNLPLESKCFECHEAKEAAEGKKVDPPASCDTCHPGYKPEWLPGADFTDTKMVAVHPPAIVLPDPNLKFNHKIHVDKGVKCATCHGTMKDIDLATRENALPVMGTCIDCHDGKAAPSQCRTCHLTNPDGKMKTDLAGGKLAPDGWYFLDAHDDNWLASHASVASLGENGCESCHTQKECLDCHNGVTKPLKVHPNNWILSHTIPAKRNDPNCQSCHRSQTFCVDCHEATKVGVTAKNKPDSVIQFHPEGWVERNANGPARNIRGPNHHAFQAQRNIRACASCHTESSCIECHGLQREGVLAGSPYRINPHPPLWARGGDCVRMRNKNERGCYKCHDATSQAMRCGD